MSIACANVLVATVIQSSFSLSTISAITINIKQITAITTRSLEKILPANCCTRENFVMTGIINGMYPENIIARPIKSNQTDHAFQKIVSSSGHLAQAIPGQRDPRRLTEDRFQCDYSWRILQQISLSKLKKKETAGLGSLFFYINNLH